MIKSKSVVFLDRDGVLCKEKGYTKCVEELEIFDYAENAIKILKTAGYITIVITNQSGIARGYFSEEELHKMNAMLQQKTHVDAIYYCPHYPPTSEEHEEPPYQVKCQCRKPQTALIERAVKDFKLDLNDAYFIGDRASDIEAGKRIGAVTVLLESGYGSSKLEKNVESDLIFNDLLQFALYLSEKRRDDYAI